MKKFRILPKKGICYFIVPPLMLYNLRFEKAPEIRFIMLVSSFVCIILAARILIRTYKEYREGKDITTIILELQNYLSDNKEDESITGKKVLIPRRVYFYVFYPIIVTKVFQTVDAISLVIAIPLLISSIICLFLAGMHLVKGFKELIKIRKSIKNGGGN